MTNEEIVDLIQKGIDTTENMEQLYKQNITLIRRFVKPYTAYESAEDLEQESYFGLMEAVKRYNPQIECKFISYAQWWIVQTVRRYVINNSYAVRIPEHMRGKISRYNKYVNTYKSKYVENPSENKISSDMDLTVNQLENIRKYGQNTISLYLKKVLMRIR